MNKITFQKGAAYKAKQRRKELFKIILQTWRFFLCEKRLAVVVSIFKSHRCKTIFIKIFAIKNYFSKFFRGLPKTILGKP